MLRLSKIRIVIGLGIFFIFLLTAAAYCDSKKLIDLDFKNADVKDVLRALAAQNRSNLLIDNEVSGAITIHLTKVTFDNALNIISQTEHLQYIKDDNVYKISQIDNAVLNVDYIDNLLTVDAQNAKIGKLILMIAEKTGQNLVPDPDLNERVSIRLRQIPLQNGLDSILIQAGCTAEKNGAVTFIHRKAANQQPFAVTYQNNLLSIDAQNIPLASLTRAITEKTGVSVVPSQDVNINISIYLQNLPLTDALTLLCSSNNLQLQSNGQAWQISRAVLLGPGSQNININYDSKNAWFDIEVQSASLTSVISEMARKANLDLIVMAQVNWTVNNIRLHKMKFERALDYLLKGTVFTYKLENNAYVIGDGMTVRPENSEFTVVKVYPIKYIKADVLLNTLPAIFSRQNFVLLTDKNALIVTAPESVHKLFANYLSQVDIDDNQDRTAVIKVKYLKAEDVLKYLPASISKSDLVVVKETNSITVTGPQNLINQVQQYITKIDQVNPLIVFTVMVVSIQNSNDFNWTPPSGSYTLPNGKVLTVGPSNPTVSYGDPTKITDSEGNTTTETALLQLTYLVSTGKAKILSNPTITALNGYAASFDVSTKRIYSVPTSTSSNGVTTITTTNTTVDSGLYVTITPWVSDGKITMEVKPKISEYGAIPQNAQIPETTEHSTETTVRVNNNEPVIISGLKSTRQSTSIAKIPILGDIPLLGLLFKSKSVEDVQEEFVIVITPKIIYDDAGNTEATSKLMNHLDPSIQEEFKDDNSPADTGKKGKAKKK